MSPVRWETDSHPEAGGHPQELLNKQIVEDADMAIALFGHRMGTPTKVALSGTVEEIQILINKGRPVILYFSKADIPHDHDPQQLAAVRSFQKSMRDKAIYGTFSTSEELRRSATAHISMVVNEIAKKIGLGPADHSVDPEIRQATRSLIDATRDLQWAAWSFFSLHTEYGVLREVREVAEKEEKIMERLEKALHVFTQDYDLPADVTTVLQEETKVINLQILNLQAFATNHEEASMEQAAREIQNACERIRAASKPYAYRFFTSRSEPVGEERTERIERSDKATRQTLEQKRKLYNLVRKISWLEVDFKFPPGPTGAGFNVNTIRQVNQDIQNIQDALSELLDLPEAKKLMAYVIPNPPDTSWKSLETIYCQYFEPLKNLYRALKKEVLEIET